MSGVSSSGKPGGSGNGPIRRLLDDGANPFDMTDALRAVLDLHAEWTAGRSCCGVCDEDRKALLVAIAEHLGVTDVPD